MQTRITTSHIHDTRMKKRRFAQFAAVVVLLLLIRVLVNKTWNSTSLYKKMSSPEEKLVGHKWRFLPHSKKKYVSKYFHQNLHLAVRVSVNESLVIWKVQKHDEHSVTVMTKVLCQNYREAFCDMRIYFTALTAQPAVDMGYTVRFSFGVTYFSGDRVMRALRMRNIFLSCKLGINSWRARLQFASSLTYCCSMRWGVSVGSK